MQVDLLCDIDLNSVTIEITDFFSCLLELLWECIPLDHSSSLSALEMGVKAELCRSTSGSPCGTRTNVDRVPPQTGLLTKTLASLLKTQRGIQ